MKTGRLFWGVFLLAFGLLVLLDRWDFTIIAAGTARKLWPLMFILWGISALATKRTLKAIAVALSGLVLALTVFGVVSFFWHWGDDGVEEVVAQEFSESLDSSAARASFKFESGGGSFRIDDQATDLVSASTKSNLGRYELLREKHDGEDLVQMSLGGRRVQWTGGRWQNKVNIHLNARPVWTLDCDVGAASFDADLAALKLKQMNVNAGASSIQIRIGAELDSSKVSVDAGASKIRLEVPRSAGCEVQIEGGLSTKRLPDFGKVESGVYRTENFQTAERRVFVSVKSGVSTVRVERY
jgi:hypothetical protein